ncbi:helix-turn-helix transcriptional regulator [Acinetobacter sp. HY1485]|uniref:helix-turn-helix transcriptional regulator n=1 Tax=Acinetobacter sp. HY1485 TaxID=2970918 RepID=UPI0022B99F99|nr:YafY family protein [Acinetobacter sp. HY1485]
MSRTQRLLRKQTTAITGQTLATALGISLRTLYRDIAELQSQGADILGEAGTGYVLRQDLVLAPLKFTANELEAVMLGIQWVQKLNDPDLTKSAQNALHKIKAVTNTPTTSLRVGPIMYAQHNVDLHSIRQAIRHKKEILIEYLSLKNENSTRMICPITIGYFEKNAVLVGWCIQKQDFRHFRLDRIAHLTVLNSQFHDPKSELLKQWQTTVRNCQ